MRRKIDVVLDAQKELLFRVIEKPEEVDKLPKKSILLPEEKIIVPFRNIKSIGDILIMPNIVSVDRLRKRVLD